ELVSNDFSGSLDNWIDFEDPRPDESRTRLITLETLLTTILDYSQTIEFAIETKHPVRYGKYVERELFDVLERYGLTTPQNGNEFPRARVMSFSQLAVQRFKKMSPLTEVVYLAGKPPRRFRNGTLPVGVSISGIDIHYLKKDPDYVDRVHSCGHEVHVWTVDDIPDVDFCLELGVDAIISNHPGDVIARVEKWSKHSSREV
nr:glycerophosphodiester phosphodiesterase [Actinomycetes bacterium]